VPGPAAREPAGRAPEGRRRRRRAAPLEVDPPPAVPPAEPAGDAPVAPAGDEVVGPGVGSAPGAGSRSPGPESADVVSWAGPLWCAAVPRCEGGAEAPFGALGSPDGVDAGAGDGPLGSVAGSPALDSDMETIPFRTAHEARSRARADPLGSAGRGSQREPSRSIH